MEIKSIEQLINSLLIEGKKFVSYECKNLLAAGENYGSVMLDVKIKLKTAFNKEEIVNCVAKTCPPSELIWKVFNTVVTFKKEIAVYREIVPALNEFGHEKGIENLMPFFAKCIGARVSADPTSDQVDKDAVLLLENIKHKGFSIGDRFIGFNMDETQLILRDLAVFHAAPIAYKLQKPNDFQKKIRPYLNKDFNFKFPEPVVEHTILLFKTALSRSAKCIPLIPKMEANFRRYCMEFCDNSLEVREPFATMVHNDYWTNNTMLRHDENGIPVENVFVDFQILEYNSPAHDLIFFLYTSVEIELIEKNFDYFVKYYFDRFIETLKKLNCDLTTFSFKAFVEEMAVVANQIQFSHVLFMLSPIYTKKGEAKELSDFKNDEDIIINVNNIHENFYRRMQYVVMDFENRGWL